MNAYTSADTMHRLAKRAMDNGTARSREEAEAMFADTGSRSACDDAIATDRHHQTAILTAVALGRRVFLGGVTVAGNVNVRLSTPLPFGSTLADAIVALGGTLGDMPVGVPRHPYRRPSGERHDGILRPAGFRRVARRHRPECRRRHR